MPEIPISEGLYDRDLDFRALARLDSDFAEVFKNGQIDFHDPRAVQQLTKSLLKHDFKLTLSIPDNRLCPPVPVRYNYIRWLCYLLSTSNPSYTPPPSPPAIKGLDIGTGATAIYPLLGTTLHESWTFHATDIDNHSLSFARTNITQNRLTSRIHLHATAPSDTLIPLAMLGEDTLDFTMCNPPFYSSRSDFLASATSKSSVPSAICTGSETEMITAGGDSGFVLRMIDESLVLREKVRWYTSMLGKLSSLHKVVARLKEVGCTNWAVASLRAGKQTRRWAVGWSWGDLRVRNDVGRWGEVGADLWPVATAQTVLVSEAGREVVKERLERVMRGLDVSWAWEGKSGFGVVEARGNVWSRAARRKKAKLDKGDQMEVATEGVRDMGTEQIVALAVRVTPADGEADLRWLRGRDHVLFESFCGMMKRALNQA